MVAIFCIHDMNKQLIQTLSNMKLSYKDKTTILAKNKKMNITFAILCHLSRHRGFRDHCFYPTPQYVAAPREKQKQDDRPCSASFSSLASGGAGSMLNRIGSYKGQTVPPVNFSCREKACVLNRTPSFQ